MTSIPSAERLVRPEPSPYKVAAWRAPLRATSPEDERDDAHVAPAEDESDPTKVVDPVTLRYPDVSTPVTEYWRAAPDMEVRTPVRPEPSPYKVAACKAPVKAISPEEEIDDPQTAPADEDSEFAKVVDPVTFK